MESDYSDLGFLSMNIGKRDIYYAKISDQENKHHVFEFYVNYESVEQVYYYEVWKYDISEKKKNYFKSFCIDLSEFKDNFEYNDESTHCEIITKYMEKVVQSEFYGENN